MDHISTLYPDLRRLLSDEMSLVWSDDELLNVLVAAQTEYFRRTRAYRILIETEVIDDVEHIVGIFDNTEQIEFAHNDDYLQLTQIDYHSALRLEGGLLDTEFGTPCYLYNRKGLNGGFKTYPNCEGTLDVYDWSDDFGVTLSLTDEDFEITGGDWGVAGYDHIFSDGFGLIDTFKNYDGDKLVVNLSIKVDTNFILVRFKDALIWRAAAELLQQRTETEDLGRSDMFQKIFSQYIGDEIRLLKRRTGIKAHGGHF